MQQHLKILKNNYLFLVVKIRLILHCYSYSGD